MEPQPLLSTAIQAEALGNHRRQSFWRVTFPVILASLVVIALVVLAIVTTGGGGNVQDSHWANISLIWLLIPSIFGGIIILVVVGALIFVMVKLLNALPDWAATLQHYMIRVSQIARTISDKVSAPVIKTKSTYAAARRLKNRLIGRS